MALDFRFYSICSCRIKNPLKSDFFCFFFFSTFSSSCFSINFYLSLSPKLLSLPPSNSPILSVLPSASSSLGGLNSISNFSFFGLIWEGAVGAPFTPWFLEIPSPTSIVVGIKWILFRLYDLSLLLFDVVELDFWSVFLNNSLSVSLPDLSSYFLFWRMILLDFSLIVGVKACYAFDSAFWSEISFTISLLIPSISWATILALILIFFDGLSELMYWLRLVFSVCSTSPNTSLVIFSYLAISASRWSF